MTYVTQILATMMVIVIRMEICFSVFAKKDGKEIFVKNVMSLVVILILVRMKVCALVEEMEVISVAVGMVSYYICKHVP